MRFARFTRGEQEGLAVACPDGGFHGLLNGEAGVRGWLDLPVRSGHGALRNKVEDE
jgi:hypothetical protein